MVHGNLAFRNAVMEFMHMKWLKSGLVCLMLMAGSWGGKSFATIEITHVTCDEYTALKDETKHIENGGSKYSLLSLIENDAQQYTPYSVAISFIYAVILHRDRGISVEYLANFADDYCMAHPNGVIFDAFLKIYDRLRVYGWSNASKLEASRAAHPNQLKIIQYTIDTRRAFEEVLAEVRAEYYRQ
jgi:hypothetical protein